jgi:DNA-binding NtrC family response regulator
MKTSEPLSIYLVDDDQLFITSLKDQVKKMFKFETNIQTFSTGEECLKNLKNPPDIIILDYFLNSNSPNAMDGLKVLKKIMELNPETKVIMLSAQDKMEVAVNLIKFGAYDYVIKNDNVFNRLKLVISNAANSIKVAKELKNYKLMGKIAVGFFAGMIIICSIVQLFFPEVFIID